MKTNQDLKKDVQDAIEWEPLLKKSKIQVDANAGVITLCGSVDSYAKKSHAENAAKSVAGVNGIVEQIEVRLSNRYDKTDSVIAKEALNALKLDPNVPPGKVIVIVEDGKVTLDGGLPWNYQRESAKRTVSNLDGMKALKNNIQIKNNDANNINKKDIEKAFIRHWSIGHNNIRISVSGDSVRLNGTVKSLYELAEAERLAWNTPGIRNVKNELVINNERTADVQSELN